MDNASSILNILIQEVFIFPPSENIIFQKSKHDTRNSTFMSSTHIIFHHFFKYFQICLIFVSLLPWKIEYLSIFKIYLKMHQKKRAKHMTYLQSPPPVDFFFWNTSLFCEPHFICTLCLVVFTFNSLNSIKIKPHQVCIKFKWVSGFFVWLELGFLFGFVWFGVCIYFCFTCFWDIQI